MHRSGIEIERKYIIRMPDLSELCLMPEYTVSQIEQIYLESPLGETLRIRRREYQGKTEYIETRKIRIDKMSSEEIERSITHEEYEALSAGMAQGTSPIIKARHTFMYLGQLFELDVYPQWKSTCIMETELNDRDRAVELPALIHIVREVTGEREYSNASMSLKFPIEDQL